MEVVMDGALTISIKILYAVFVFLSGMYSGVISSQQSPSETWIEQLLGPLGALAFALVAIGFLIRYLQRKEKRVEDLQDKLLEEAQKEAEFWKQKANKN